MYEKTANNEVIIKLVGKLSLEFPEIDQLKVRNIAEEVLYKYDVLPQETALVTTDIEDRLQMYLAVKRLEGLSKKTLKNYNYNLIILANRLRKPLANIDVMDLRMFLADRCKNMKPSSMNGQISILKSFFGWLCNEGYIPKNPTVNLKQTKEPKRVRHALSDEEVEMLKQACTTDREKALVEVLISTGCRLSEIIEINVDEINFSEKSLYVIGKGDKERKVYFSTKAKILVKKYLANRKGESNALFTTIVAPYRRLGARSVEKEIKKVAAKANIEKSIFPHLFRHTMATSSLNKGMPISAVQKLLGHTDPATTQIYAIYSEENIMHEYKKIS